MEHESDGITLVIGTHGPVTRGFGTGTAGHGNKSTSGDHPNYCVVVVA